MTTINLLFKKKLRLSKNISIFLHFEKDRD